MYILGINAFHGDSAACLVRDGEIVAAGEEERFRRVKHWAGFPSEAIRWCLEEAKITLDDVSDVAFNQNSRANLGRKVAYLLKQPPKPGLIVDRIRNRLHRETVGGYLAGLFLDQRFRGEVHRVEHHLAHLSSAFHVSPFDQAAIVSVDGFGDFSSAAWGVGRGVDIRVEDRVFFPHSLGIFYQALTQFLGFPHYGDEYKVMGLAPYGEPRFVDDIGRLVHMKDDGGFKLDLAFFRHHREQVPSQWSNGVPTVGDLFSPKLEDLLGPRRGSDQPIEQRHKDIARSTQAVYEKAFFNLLSVVRERSGLTDLALAGGCAANSVANGKIRRRTGFRRAYVQAAPGDAGGAIGAAFVVWHKKHVSRSFRMDHAYWGPSFSDAEITSLLDRRAGEFAFHGCNRMRVTDSGELCRIAAEAVAAGLVVGWFQGRMEWGPRALGNRSILCDPRRADMKETLNAKIKRRESFRPFAPSILREAVDDWFEEDDDVPFMMQVFQIRQEKRSLIPAVTHVDGSGRLQTVRRDTNPLYHRLISAFRDLTGVPLMLNTSFNENEPVVCRPEEALDCFLRTRMDMLVLGETVMRRPNAVAPGKSAIA